jgi:hypothetical protein
VVQFGFADFAPFCGQWIREIATEGCRIICHKRAHSPQKKARGPRSPFVAKKSRLRGLRGRRAQDNSFLPDDKVEDKVEDKVCGLQPIEVWLARDRVRVFRDFAVRGNRGCCGSEIRAPLIQASGPPDCRRSAGCQTCCIADFQIGGGWRFQDAGGFVQRAGLETRDTADSEVSEVCATCSSRNRFTV